MAKQTNIVTFQGKLGGISFYKRDGKDVARRASGPSKSAILKHPNFQRTRENMKEFQGLAVAVANFSKCLGAVRTIMDGKFRGTLSKVLRSMMKVSPDVRGERPVLISQNRDALRGLELNKTNNFGTLFTGKFTASHTADRNSGKIEFDAFDAMSKVVAPQGATHFQFINLVCSMSDTVFNAASTSFELADPALNELSQITYSPEYAINAPGLANIALESILPGAPVMSNKVTTLLCLGIIFFEKSGNAFYQMNSAKAMMIVEAY
jgi:hypothetical protein